MLRTAPCAAADAERYTSRQMAPSLTKVALWTFAILLGLMIVPGVVMLVFIAGTASVNAFISLPQPHLSSLRGAQWQDLLFLAVLFISGIAIPTLHLLVTAGRRGLLTHLSLVYSNFCNGPLVRRDKGATDFLSRTREGETYSRPVLSLG